MLKMVSYKMANFYKDFTFFELPPLCEKGENIPLKTGPEGDSRFLGFCFLYKRVYNNEDQICSKWSDIKWETFIRKYS